jgi:hypothetical protein
MQAHFHALGCIRTHDTSVRVIRDVRVLDRRFDSSNPQVQRKFTVDDM